MLLYYSESKIYTSHILYNYYHKTKKYNEPPAVSYSNDLFSDLRLRFRTKYYNLIITCVLNSNQYESALVLDEQFRRKQKLQEHSHISSQSQSQELTLEDILLCGLCV